MEYVKDAADKAVAVAILEDVFWKALRLLHPYMPFVTEEVAHQLGFLKDGETILRAAYPTGYTPDQKSAWGLTDAVYDFVNAKRGMITDLRALRGEYKVAPSAFVKVTVDAKDAAPAALLAADMDTLKAAMRAEAVEIVSDGADRAMPGKLGALGTVYLSLEGLVDKAAEAKRIAAELAKLAGFIKAGEAKLANEQFTGHAPAQIVETARRQLEENRAKAAQLEKLARLFA